MKPINQQTTVAAGCNRPGAVHVSRQYYADKLTGWGVLCIGANHSTSSVLLAEVKPMAGEAAPYVESEANAALLAASYTSFDRAARELGVDAVELAESIDLAEVIRYALDYGWPAPAALLSKIKR